MRTNYPAVLFLQFLLVVSVSYPVRAQVVKPFRPGLKESSGSHVNSTIFAASEGLYFQIFMPVGNYISKYGNFGWPGFQTWSFSPLPKVWVSPLYMQRPGAYYDQNISLYLLRSQYNYSYIPLIRLNSNRFYQTMVLALTPGDKYKVTIFSNLVLNKVKIRSDNIFLNFEGTITPNLTYNLNFDLNTDGLYVDPVRLIDLNSSSIPDSKFTLHYYFD